MLVTVANFTEPYEAHLFRFRLEAEGIPAVLVHEHHVGLNWPWAMALGGAKVQVLQEEWSNAAAIERRCRNGDYRAELQAEFGDLDDPKCPHCGAAKFTSRPEYMMALLLVTLFLFSGIIFPLRDTVRHCKVCGSVWLDSLRSVRLLSSPLG